MRKTSAPDSRAPDSNAQSMFFEPSGLRVGLSPSKTPSDSIVVIADRAHDLPARVIEMIANNNVDDSLERVSQVIAGVWGSISPERDSGKSTEVKFLRSEKGGVLNVVLCALPSLISRHNSPARTHAITDFVSSHGKKNFSMIICVLNHHHHALAVSTAVAKGLPQYSCKTNQSGSSVTSPSVQLVLHGTGHDDDQSEDGAKLVARLQHAVNGIRFACGMVDAPCNVFHVGVAVEEANAVAARCCAAGKQVAVSVIRGEELARQGLGGIYGVGKAAVNEPALVVLSHVPSYAKAVAGNMVWVAKGIVYDTGGLSIKTKTGMPGMKRDMAACAAVMAAFESAVLGEWCSSCPLYAVLCLAENSVGPEATRPDDIHTLYSGKSVEINNTDAEGRLVLGDGVAYATKHLNPKYLVDMATLTGAQGVATGKRHAGLYCCDEDFENVLVVAGRSSGDLTHPLPYCPEFFRKEFTSKVADMKNSVKNRNNAQASCAGQFIANHMQGYIDKGGVWCHIDMAAPSEKDERATAYGVALLLTALEELGLSA